MTVAIFHKDVVCFPFDLRSGKDTAYEGSRDAKGITTFIKGRMGPAVKELADEAAVKKHTADGISLVEYNAGTLFCVCVFNFCMKFSLFWERVERCGEITSQCSAIIRLWTDVIFVALFRCKACDCGFFACIVLLLNNVAWFWF